MLRKRKLIKKNRSKQKSNVSLEQTQIQYNQSLFDKLKSSNPSDKEQVITILANLNVSFPEISQPQFIRQLINVLFQTNNTIAYQTIFALANLCDIQRNLVNKLFQNGLDKALIQLSSTDKELLKPILVFFITIADNLPIKYYYLLKGVQNSLSIEHLRQNSELCLEFLFRTHNLRELNLQLSDQMLKQIAGIFSSTCKTNQKSYAIAILAQSFSNKNNWNSEIQEILINYMTEMLICINLQKQYKINLSNQKLPAENMKYEQQNPLMEEKQQEQMEEQNEGKQNSHKALNKEQRQKRNQKLKLFMSTIQGTQILLEFILDALGKNDGSDEQESDEEQVQQFEEQNMQQKGNKIQQKSSSLRQVIVKFIKQNMSIFPKFLCLSSSVVPSTQNILQLFYYLLMEIDKQLGLSTSNNQQNKVQINQLIQMSLSNLFKSMKQGERDILVEEYEVLIECLEIGLKVILKNKGVGIQNTFLLQFSKQYLISDEILKSRKLVEQVKASWMIMLQLFSKLLNPQKNKNISKQQNLQAGQILKHLLVSIPYTQLQQFRCQVIDTLFDIYSNEDFDFTFVQLGFFNLLQTVLKQPLPAKQTKGKAKKSNKFIFDVLKDIKRFLEYKHKMIKL